MLVLQKKHGSVEFGLVPKHHGILAFGSVPWPELMMIPATHEHPMSCPFFSKAFF
jgi:hypothetical protein